MFPKSRTRVLRVRDHYNHKELEVREHLTNFEMLVKE